MKIENPLFRRAEISFHHFDGVVDIWTTDSEIETLNWIKRENFTSLRLQSSPWSIIEFFTYQFKDLKCTNEIRHQLSPIIVKMVQKRNTSANQIHSNFLRFNSKYLVRSIAYFHSGEGDSTVVDFTGIPDWDLIFLTSLKLFEEILMSYFPGERSLNTNNLLFIEHFFLNN
jgi:hypothetical protein